MKRRMYVMLLLAAVAIPLMASCDSGSTPTPTAIPATPAATAAAITPTTASSSAATPTTAMVNNTPTTAASIASTPTTASASGNKPIVYVSSKNFTEEYIIGEMYALALENAGIPVDRSKMNLGATDIAQQAIVKGDISLYPEYTGTSLGVVLKVDLTSSPDWHDADKVYQKVKDEYEKQFHLTVLTPAPMNDTQAIAMTADGAAKNGIKTLSDLSAKAPNLTLISTAEFDNRSDGLPGLQKAYGGFQFKQVNDIDNSLKYDALLKGQGDAVIAYSTEGAIAANKLVVLDDDKHFYPPYPVAPVVRDDIIAAYPNMPTILNAVDAKITNDEISKLNALVDISKQDYKQVAKDWMTQQGLLGGAATSSTPAMSGTPASPAMTATTTTTSTSSSSNTQSCTASSSTGANMAASNPVLVAQAGTSDSIVAQNKPTVFVSSKNFTEEYIIGEMYALGLENAGIPVDRSKMNLGATDIAQQAIVKGDISLYPEYTGTSLGVVLKVDLTSSPDWHDADKVYQKVKQCYEQLYKLTVLTPAPMNDTQAIAMTKDTAAKYGIKSLSDLSAKASQLTLISTAEFDNRADGLPGLQKAYGGFQFKQVNDIDNSLKYDALLKGQGDAVIAYSTEGAIASNNLLVLDDDKHFYPPYPVAPVVRDDIIAAYPNLPDILNAIDAKITNDEISALNAKVDIQKQDYKQVAKDWMKSKGLIK